MEVKTVKISELKPHPKNPRVHPDSAISKLVRSIREFGWTNPILVSAEGFILAGHARVKAAEKAGIEEVPVIYLPLSGAKAEAYMIADNRLQDETDWDKEKLEALLRELDAAGYDTQLTGFDEDELNELIDSIEVDDDQEEDFDAAEALERIAEPRCQEGEVWRLGRHRLLCGDSTRADSWRTLFGQDKADLLITSPPYNVGIEYHSYQDKKAKDEYLSLIAAVGENAFAWLKPGRFVAWNVGVSPESYPHYHVVTLEGCGFEFYRQIIWEKTGVPWPIFPSSMRARRARHYRPNYKHEVIYLLRMPAEELGQEELPEVECPICDGTGSVHGHVAPDGHEMLILMTNGQPQYGDKINPTKRYANDVWHIAQSRATVDLPTLGKKGSGLKKCGKDSHMVKAHPAAFPVELPKAVMTFLSAEGEIVVDPFIGAGATLIAAEEMGRVCYGIELDPLYCELTMQRWEKLTGERAVREDV